MSLGNAFPVRSTVQDVTTVQGVWTGAGAADCTHDDADWNQGIVSVVYGLTGVFQLTFLNVGQQIVAYDIKVDTADDAPPLVGKIRVGSLSYSASSCDVEFWGPVPDADVAVGDPVMALTNPPAASKVRISVSFSKVAPNGDGS